MQEGAIRNESDDIRNVRLHFSHWINIYHEIFHCPIQDSIQVNIKYQILVVLHILTMK